ncbi:MAG: sensor domain-containing diguanylate cyclase [Candidatus Solibacter sp.]|nr:sensor domain-containing diguanylate cyclase [Candidatus Solibacter sp.]
MPFIGKTSLKPNARLPKSLFVGGVALGHAQTAMKFDQAGLLADHIPNGMYLVDKDRRIVDWNAAAERLTGYKKQEVVGKCCGDGILEHVDEFGNSLCGDRCPLLMAARLGMDCRSDVFMHHKRGHRVPVHVLASPIRAESGEITGMVETFTDNTAKLELLERARELERIALIDALTGIGNRRYCEQQIRRAIDGLYRNGTPFGVVLWDTDNFKSINDRYGHACGDAVLRMVGQSLASNLRSLDFAGRWGGEEFIVLFHNSTAAGGELIARRLRVLVQRSFVMWDGTRVAVTVSGGVAQARPDETVDSLYCRADRLLYQAKAAGKNRFASDHGIEAPALDGCTAA